MSRATGPGALPRQRRSSLAAKMPARCVGPSRSGRPRGKRWGTGTYRGCRARRRARSSIWRTRRKSAERLRDCQRSWAKGQPAETADAAVEETLGTSRTADSLEAARDPKAVWLNGAVGEPEVVGPDGSVWVTRCGGEAAEDSSSRGFERKGRPGAMEHESILELWLKVQAMRAASGCGVGSRVELHPVPAGEGPVEKGIPGRASWLETSQGGVTGPWVRGQARAFPQVSGLSTAIGLGRDCERASASGGHRQAGKVLPLAVAPGAMEELGHALTSSPWERPQSVGQPEALEVKMGCGTSPDECGRGQSLQVPGALGHEAVCGDTSGLWVSGQTRGNLDAVMLPRAVEEETTSECTSGMWRRRQEVEDRSPEGLPGVWGTEQLVGMPCATAEEETRCGGDLRGEGQGMWIETGSGGDPVSWEAAQTVEPSGPGEEESSSQQVPQGLWGIEQPVGIPRTLGKETDYVSVPGLWGTGQLPQMSQAVLVPEARSEDISYGGVPDLWERQQVLGTPLAEATEETHSKRILSSWERGQAVGEQEALVPGALGASGPTDEQAGSGTISCLCGRRRALRASETVEVPKAAGVARHRSSPAGIVTALRAPESGRVPATLWASGPMCQESSSRDTWNLWERACAVRMPVYSRRAVAPEERWSVGEDTGSGAFPASWGRRQAVRVPGAPEAPDPLNGEIASGDFSGSPERRHTVGIPVPVVESPACGRGVVPRVLSPAWEETGSGSSLGLCREKRACTKSSTRKGVSISARMPGSIGQRVSSECISALSGSRQTSRISMAVGLSEPAAEETPSEGLLGLSGKRLTAEMSVAARPSVPLGVPTASGVHGPQMIGESTSGDGSGTWERRQATEASAVHSPGSVEGETNSESVSSWWRRRHNGPLCEALRIPVPFGRVGAVGAPVAGHVPAAVWVTGSSGEAANMGISCLTTMSRQSTERAESSGEQTRDGGSLGMAGRGEAVGESYTSGLGTRFWSCSRSMGVETAHENVPRVSGIRMAMTVPTVSREEMGPSHFRDHPQQSGRRQIREVSGISVRGNDLTKNCVGEDALRGVSSSL